MPIAPHEVEAGIEATYNILRGAASENRVTALERLMVSLLPHSPALWLEVERVRFDEVTPLGDSIRQIGFVDGRFLKQEIWVDIFLRPGGREDTGPLYGYLSDPFRAAFAELLTILLARVQSYWAHNYPTDLQPAVKTLIEAIRPKGRGLFDLRKSQARG